MRKKLLFLFLLTLIISSLTSPALFAKSLNEATGKVRVQLVLPYSKQFPVPSNEEKQRLIDAGWIETTEGFVRYYPLANVKVELDDEVVAHTDYNGRFYINNIESGEHEFELNHNAINKKEVISLENGQKIDFDFSITINFMTFMEGPEFNTSNFEEINKVDLAITPSAVDGNPYAGGYNGETTTSHNGHTDATYAKNSYVTCNRFNGNMGNQVYYDKYAHPLDAAINFSHSDCDRAIAFYGAPCLSTTNGDYASDASKRYCKSFGISITSSSTCSQLASHKPLYHKHTTNPGESGY
ncbi:hypothetical protein [Paenibacillus sp. KS-LC4]|uniref:hypothetical protein n=1 Tax=Paenibacillus sp. KS-LC4 TaxID=2979727 RepID=UPI0030CEB808